ncbi:hypothetical protein [Actinomyces polynesiensis]|uniref:hypothetical protein n=1 Tax=Actinomyces polynesiensis TaxID=1325934 RepID=UPI0005B9DDF3|nr:hypothetical protein [Actinomyces polynesiensis]
MPHESGRPDPPWSTEEETIAARRHQDDPGRSARPEGDDEASPHPGTHGIQRPQEGLGIGNASLDDPYADHPPDDPTPAGDTDGVPAGAGAHRGEPATATGTRRFNESEPHEGPAWVDQPDGGRGRPPARHAAPSGEDPVPVEEIRPEDLPEVGEPQAQPGAPFEVQGPDRP